MNWASSARVSKILLFTSLVLLLYMPLHVFVSTYFSTFTGGLDAWKAAKDVVVFVGAPGLLYLSYRRGLFADKTFRVLLITGALYALLHGLFLLFDSDDDVVSTITASVFNTRLLAFLLLGYLVGSAKHGQKYLKYALTTTVLIATATAVFGVLQYVVLPHDFLVDFGYEVERGVRPLFFIDDKPDLPRVMSTLKDPNSFGAYLIVPILLTALALFKQKANSELFVRPFRKSVLAVMLSMQSIALILTFSRGALLALLISAGVLAVLQFRPLLVRTVKRFWYIGVIGSLLLVLFGFAARDTYVFENIVFHSDESTVLADSNEKRVQLVQDAVSDVLETPLGHGPGTAGLVAISNPNGGVLTENYYLQIAYEVGWLGLVLFLIILVAVGSKLYHIERSNLAAGVLLAAFVGHLFYSLLIHLWSNEAVALQWWLLCGMVLAQALHEEHFVK